MTDTVELDGQRYVWTGSRWYRERDYVAPAGVVLGRLRALRPDTHPSDGTFDGSLNCPRSLRAMWPDPLAGQWMEKYPQLFDADDYRCTRRQPTKHFWEWNGAIHIFKREGAYSLIEKYDCGPDYHPVKVERLASILSDDQVAFVKSIYSDYHTQVPDLFCYAPETGRFWFVEVKGPTDSLRPNQVEGHKAIERELGVPVEILEFDLIDD